MRATHWPERLLGEGPAETICLGCGCTDSQACVDGAGRPCSWAVRDPAGIGLCSLCLVRPIAELAARLDALTAPARIQP